jgi:hypothetical protein
LRAIPQSGVEKITLLNYHRFPTFSDARWAKPRNHKADVVSDPLTEKKFEGKTITREPTALACRAFLLRFIVAQG